MSDEPDRPIGLAASVRALCVAACGLVAADGATVSLFSGSIAGRARITASDAWAASVDEQQFALGEGPCFEAYARNEPVEVVDVGSADGFPAFATAATGLGVRWMLALPIPCDGTTVGVFDLMRRQPGRASLQARESAALFVPLLAAGLQQIGDQGDVELAGEDSELASYRWEVHQAIGVLRARERVDVQTALARLRAHAYAYDLPLAEVARQILAGEWPEPSDAQPS